jgi:O-antigen ligase
MSSPAQQRMYAAFAALITAMLCVHYSRAYFSHALILFALFCIYFFIKKGRRTVSAALSETDLPARLFTISLILFYGALFISAAVNRDAAGFRMGLSYAALAIPFFMTYTLGRLTKSEIGERCGFLFAGLIICAYAFIAHNELYDERLFSFFAHPNALGTYAALFLPFVFLYIIRAKALSEKIALGILTTLLLYCLWKSGSRGAIAALAGGSALTILTLVPMMECMRNRRKLLVSLLLAAAFLGCGFFAVSQITEDRMQHPENLSAQALIDSKMGGERVLMWETSIKMWENHKLAGVGLANWEKTYYSKAYHPKKGQEKDLDMPHNMPLYFLSTAGVIGAVGYAAFLLLSFAALCKSLKTAADPFFTAAALAASFAFAIQGLVDTTIINTIPARIHFALMGYYFSCRNGFNEDVNINE